MSLKSKLIEIIKLSGPISVSQYMAHCLYDFEFGYYRKSKVIGKEGDFITAPEISQLFGECIAFFILTHWHECNKSHDINLIEFGPGRGTLMKDIVRVLEVSKSFNANFQIHFLEANSELREIQKTNLKKYEITYHDEIATLPSQNGVANYLIANEFFDCLPIDQYISQDRKWHEKLIGLAGNELVFGISPPLDTELIVARDGAIIEQAPSLKAMVETFCNLIIPNNGAAIIFDYGYFQHDFSNTFQAVKRHQKCSVLEDPGECDLTAHVDFGAITKFANEFGVFTQGPMTQARFLRTMGIEARASALIDKTPNARQKVQTELARLIGKDEMGELFKTIILHL